MLPTYATGADGYWGAISQNEMDSALPYGIRHSYYARLTGKLRIYWYLVYKVGTNGGLQNLCTWPETCFRVVPCLISQINPKFTNSRCAFMEILYHYHAHLDASNAHIEQFHELKPISPPEPPVPAVDLRDSPPKLQHHRPSHGSVTRLDSLPGSRRPPGAPSEPPDSNA